MSYQQPSNRLWTCSSRSISRFSSRLSSTVSSEIWSLQSSQFYSMLIGRQGALIYLRQRRAKSMFFIQSCFLSSSIPLAPSLLLGFLCSSWLMKWTASSDHRLGSSSSLTAACLLRIWSRISFLFLPTQGLLPSINSQAMTPTAKQSTPQEWFFLHITSGAMYPGVPLVSWQFSYLNSRLTPRSVILMQPCESITRFSGLMSRWMMRLRCRQSSPTMRLAMKNLVSSSVNLRLLPMWYLKSPPLTQSMIRQRFSRSWKAQFMLIKKGCLILASRLRSFMTELMDFFMMILALYISFIAKICLLFFVSTFHTFPNPPFPIGQMGQKCWIDIPCGNCSFLGQKRDVCARFTTWGQNQLVERFFYLREVMLLLGLEVSFSEKLYLNWAKGYMDRPGDSGSLVALLVPRLWEFLRSRCVLLMSLDWTYLVSWSILLELLLVSSSLILSKLMLQMSTGRCCVLLGGRVSGSRFFVCRRR